MDNASNNADPIQHDSNREARDQFVLDFNQGTENGRWMAAFWKVEDDKIVVKRVTTFAFPKGDMVAAVGEFALRLHQANFQPKPEPDPLPSIFPDQWTPDSEVN